MILAPPRQLIRKQQIMPGPFVLFDFGEVPSGVIAQKTYSPQRPMRFCGDINIFAHHHGPAKFFMLHRIVSGYQIININEIPLTHFIRFYQEFPGFIAHVNCDVRVEVRNISDRPHELKIILQSLVVE